MAHDIVGLAAGFRTHQLSSPGTRDHRSSGGGRAREDITRDPMIVAAESTQCRGEQFSAMIVAVSDYSAVASACECTYNEALAFNDRTGLLQIRAGLLPIRSFAVICAEAA